MPMGTVPECIESVGIEPEFAHSTCVYHFSLGMCRLFSLVVADTISSIYRHVLLIDIIFNTILLVHLLYFVNISILPTDFLYSYKFYTMEFPVYLLDSVFLMQHYSYMWGKNLYGGL